MAAMLGLMYDFSPEHEPWPDRLPPIVKLLHGASTDCNLLPLMRLSCTSTRTSDNTGISAIEVGRPFVEERDQAQRGRNASKLLNYLDPSIDVSLGDLISVRALREAYVGFGVSHRSGIFGSSQVLGNVSGGSNYIYSYWSGRCDPAACRRPGCSVY